MGDARGDTENEMTGGGVIGVNGQDWQKNRHGGKRRDLVFVGERGHEFLAALESPDTHVVELKCMYWDRQLHFTAL
jgi:hypothetical protein